MAKKRSRSLRTPEPVNHDEAGIELSQITDKEWDVIKGLAVEIHKSGQSKKCMYRASVMAFVEWMMAQDQKIHVIDDGSLH